MRILGTALTFGVALAIVNCSWTLPVLAAAKTGQSRAAKLVDETLQREAREGVDDRVEMLKPARELTPPCEEAFWQSGFIRDPKRKKWLSLDEVRQQAEKDDQLTAYRKVREKYPETEGGRAELARWCAKHNLEDQARAHWTQVLNFAPDHLEARRQLGFQAIDGKWQSQQEVAEKMSEIGDAQTALRRWAPKFDELLQKAAGSNQRASEQARREMEAIKDPDAASAIKAVLCAKGGQIAMLGFELLKNLQSPRSAEVLSWHAVFSPWQMEGQSAAIALRNQEKYNYVPLLLEAAEMPANPQAQASGSNSGVGNSRPPEMVMVYRLDSGTRTSSWNTVERLNEHPDWRSVGGMRFDPKSPDPVAKKTAGTVNQGANTTTINKREYYTVKDNRLQDRHTEYKATTNWQKLTPIGMVPVNPPQTGPYPQQQPRQQTGPKSYNSDDPQQSAPLRALAEATMEKRPRTVPEWWNWWYDYNEVYRPADTTRNIPNIPNQFNSIGNANAETQSQRGDCLAADTLVCTETGSVEVEKVAVGDRIFCCDSETGRLALKPVLRKTVRPAGKLVKIRAGGEEFEASGGHVFWVAGKGWIKARDLREGMHLHTISGTIPVEGVESGKVQTTIGLVAEDFHTFFAGKGMILTHDNTIRPPTDRIVPGLAAPKATASGEIPKKAS